jgi:hypothetical protein
MSEGVIKQVTHLQPGKLLESNPSFRRDLVHLTGRLPVPYRSCESFCYSPHVFARARVRSGLWWLRGSVQLWYTHLLLSNYPMSQFELLRTDNPFYPQLELLTMRTLFLFVFEK